MLFKGTRKRPTAHEIAVAIEGIGGFFNASTSQELTNYWVKVAYQHFDLGLDVLSDMLSAPLFAANEIEKERRVIIEELRQTLDTPDELVFYDLDALMWLPHPLGRDVAGSPESVSAISRADMLAYLHRHYHANNLVVSVSGYVRAETIVPQLNAALGALRPLPLKRYTRFQPKQTAPRWHVRYKKTEQAHVAVATWAYDREHPDRYAVTLLNTILGDGMSSRLFQEIREKRGLAYTVSSFGSALEDCGYFGCYAAVEPKNALETVRAMLAEWARLTVEAVPETELAKAKEALRLPLLTVDDVTAKIDAVTAQDIQRVARALFRNAWLNLAVVGPFKTDGQFARVLRV
ncbi:MAG: insulinase family protein [Chloroflexi bacterium]|nr:MAG: insulinase family protein [Chloroflexota bacterium]